jgi:hypothetical protein
VLRRKDVVSRVASWDGCPYRMPSPPILAIVPLHRRQRSGTAELRQLACVAAIRLHRSPGLRGINAGATTPQLTRSVGSCRRKA